MRTIPRSVAVESLESRRLLAAAIAVDHARLLFNDPQGGAASPPRSVVVRNTGDQPLVIPSGGLTFVGIDAARFQLTGAPTLPTTIQPGNAATVSVAFNPDSLGPRGAALRIKSNDPARPTLDVTLRGLGTNGLGGANEPSLQWILDTYQIPVRVGDTTPAESTTNFPPATPNDEVTAQLLTRAGPGPVVIEALAVFSNNSDPAARFGFYTVDSANGPVRSELFTIPAADVQTINPRLVGSDRFTPAEGIPFGIYTVWPAFNNRIAYSEDFRNTWEPNAARRREMRWYPLRNPDGSAVPNAYVMGNEEAFNHDLQDGVFILRNVKPFEQAPDPTAVVYQAENVLLSGPVVASNETGFTGSGYVDYRNPSADFIEWTINAASAGTHSLTFRYANGGGADRPLDLKVNGTSIVSRLSFAPTGSWRTWQNVTFTAVLNAGVNKVRLTAVGSSGANIDSLTVRPVAPQTFQAETATRSGVVVQSSAAGFTGTGYVDFVHNSGDFLEWTVNAASAGQRTLEFRYALGSSSFRPMELKVNGTVVRNRLSFSSTGSWSTWRTVSLTVTLRAGENKIRLTAVGFSGPNFDALTVR